MSDFEAWKQEATPHHVSVEVCFDRNLIGEYEQARSRLKDESGGMLSAPEELKNHVEELAKAVQGKTREMVFESLGRRRWRQLLADHPPTQAQREDAEDDLAFNPETFPVAAIQACCIRPRLTLEQAQWIADELPLAVFERIWTACLAANVVGGDEKKAGATVAAAAIAKR